MARNELILAFWIVEPSSGDRRWSGAQSGDGSLLAKYLALFTLAVACLPDRGRATRGLTAESPDPCQFCTAGCWLLEPSLRNVLLPSELRFINAPWRFRSLLFAVGRLGSQS